MILLITGLLLFIGLHLIPTAGANIKSGLIERYGKKHYIIAFGSIAATSVLTIILGWQKSDPGYLYTPPIWGFHVTPILTLAAFILVLSNNMPTNIRRVIPHPRYTGIFLWAIGHLFANGELRSVLLFGGFALWTSLSIYYAGKYVNNEKKPVPQPVFKDLVTVGLASGLFIGFLSIHEWLIGVNPLPFR